MKLMVCLCGCVLGMAAQLAAGPYRDLVVLGDSLSDAGNSFAQTGQPPSPPYYAGRASDGPVWVERLAPLLGLAVPTPSALGGVNATDYAYYGARTVGGTVPSVQQQVQSYLAHNAPSPTDLFTIQGGADDFGAGVLDATVPAHAVRDDVSALLTAGARNVLVMNLPPLGKTPAFVGSPLEGFATGLSDTYDATLASDLSGLRAAYPGASILLLDANALFQQILAAPGAYGLTDVTHSALTGSPPVVVSNPDQYLFWDSGHPTATGHQLLADAAAAIVPEPTAIPLLVLMAFALRRVKREPGRANVGQ